MKRSALWFGMVLATLILSVSPASAETSIADSDADPGANLNPTPAPSFDQDISPILSRHCYACHGPDEAQRKAGLRLDRFEEATRALKSGARAIVPGRRTESELIRRITHPDDSERMPPADAGAPLARAEIERLRDWIDSGAPYQAHWAFQTPRDPELPEVADAEWPRQPLDFFILQRLEANGLRPASRATRRVLARRAYFELIGLPPSPEELDAFLADPAPDAFARLVDRLLASPHYGERWGRHWLDIARYGDSNGGDENHAYPNAFHYRNYVISAFNRGLPYDRMLVEQVAGDLLPANRNDPADTRMIHGEKDLSTNGFSASGAMDVSDFESDVPLAATGFIAIGTKILAEQDPAKKRADMVDEQIDTFGRAILGLTLGCARCHDHKFDPIPTRDYYALAGIFQSTEVGDRPVESARIEAARRDHRRKLAAIDRNLAEANAVLESNLNLEKAIEREAEDFQRGNVVVDRDRYGAGIGIISDPGGQSNFAEYEIQAPAAGEYLLQLRYAAATARPGRILLDGAVVQEPAIGAATGGWMPEHQQWLNECTIKLQTNHVLRLESEPMMSHIDRLRLVPVQPGGDLAAVIDRLQSIQDSRAQVAAEAPQPPTVMAAADGSVADSPIHVRGSHQVLGETVPRGFLTLAPPPHALPGSDSSGRLELGRWLSQPDQPLTARVMVNRIWHWHFGRGLVATPDNFGLKGERPTHPRLLDHLARRFVESGWSIKAMHRMIMLSATWQMASVSSDPTGYRIDPANRLLWKRQQKRLEAELFRDTVLTLSGHLDRRLGGASIPVKSQDPSPADLRNNQKQYESSRRRSVYLPVIRSNVYDLLTLLDFPNASTPVGRRSATTVPTQALLLMNNEFLVHQAAAIAERVVAAETDSDPARVVTLYREMLGRTPGDHETEWALEFLTAYPTAGAGDRRSESATENPGDDFNEAWAALCQTLMMSDEFIYVE